LVPGQGGADFQTAGAPQEVLLECNLLVVEDLKESANADMGPKDFFEIGYSQLPCVLAASLENLRAATPAMIKVSQ
jgi:hypothetical protein